MTKFEIEVWKCNDCKLCDGRPNSYNDQICNQSIEKLKDKIINYENKEQTNLETSLTLAAEVGNTLLVENNKLKQDLLKLTLQNSNLASEITKIRNLDITNYQAQIEQLENEKEAIYSRNVKLAEMLHDMEQQREKDRQIRLELEKNFEEYDKDKEEIILTYEKIIRDLRHELNCLSKNNPNIKSGVEGKTFSDTSTQTQPSNDELSDASSHKLLTEIAKIKTRQDDMEKCMKDLHALNILKQDTVLDELSSQNTSTPLNKNTLKQNQRKNEHFLGNRKKNVFSVSMQVAKSKMRRNIPRPEKMFDTNYLPSNPLPPTKNGMLPVKANLSVLQINTMNSPLIKRLPPMNALIRSPSESVEEFYNKHIEFYMLKNMQTEVARRNLQVSSIKTIQNQAELLKTGCSSNNIKILTEPSTTPLKLTDYSFLGPIHRKKNKYRNGKSTENN